MVNNLFIRLFFCLYHQLLVMNIPSTNHAVLQMKCLWSLMISPLWTEGENEQDAEALNLKGSLLIPGGKEMQQRIKMFKEF